MDDYLTTAELSNRIKMSPGTIRNLVWKQTFKKNIHYFFKFNHCRAKFSYDRNRGMFNMFEYCT